MDYTQTRLEKEQSLKEHLRKILGKEHYETLMEMMFYERQDIIDDIKKLNL